jgi:hypothetical protein
MILKTSNLVEFDQVPVFTPDPADFCSNCDTELSGSFRSTNTSCCTGFAVVQRWYCRCQSVCSSEALAENHCLPIELDERNWYCPICFSSFAEEYLAVDCCYHKKMIGFSFPKRQLFLHLIRQTNTTTALTQIGS